METFRRFEKKYLLDEKQYDTLLEKISTGRYKEILAAYLTFTDY